MKPLLPISLMLACIAFNMNAQVIHVPSDQSTIQAGIDSASNGDTVLVAEGTYFENINFLGKAITVASRFILDGDTSHISKTIIDGSQTSDPNYRSVVTMKTGEDTTSVLAGFTITGGRGSRFDYAGSSNTVGGGVAILFCGGKITHNIIEGNNVIDPNGVNAGGGIGALVFKNHTAISRNNTIRNNAGTGWSAGGGAYFEGGRIILEYNRIENNTLTGGNSLAAGGGVGLGPANGDGAIQEMIIRNNLVTGNRVTGTAPWGGGGILIGMPYEVGTITLSNNIISKNYTNQAGGGVFVNEFIPRLNFFNNTVLNNKAELDANSIYLGSNCSDIVMMNNILWSDENPHLDGISVGDKTVSVYAYGNILDKEFSWSESVDAKYNIVADPLVDTVSYAPAADSRSVGRGLDSVQINETWIYPPETDFSGAFRVDISPDEYYDIGAVESPFAKLFPAYNSERVIRVPDEQPTIQAGIDAAAEGDTVLVMEGRYYENIDFKGKAITVASSYILDHEEFYIPRTIIDGSRPEKPDTASVVLMWSGEDTTSVLTGFTITGGKGTEVLDAGYKYLKGGGILIINSGGKIIHNIIEDNYLEPLKTTLGVFFGCGLFVSLNNDHRAVIRNNLIRNNTGNGSDGKGGGTCLAGGGIHFENNTITQNSIRTAWFSWGAGVYWTNIANGSTHKEVIIANNSIIGNRGLSTNSWGQGAGITVWGGFPDDIVTVFNNVIRDNYSRGTGGGLLLGDTRAVVFNNTIYMNEATAGGNSVNVGLPEAGPSNYSDIVLYNNIIWSDADNGHQDFILNPLNNYTINASNNTLREPFIEEEKVTGQFNKVMEPLFQPGSYELAEYGPGIGWGIDSLEVDGTWYYAPSTDMAGNPRPHPVDSFVDLGAYESPFTGNLVYIPDENFLAALVNKGVDTSGDGRISFPEAEAVTSIDVHSKYITDVTGIEAFINIDTFDCSYNRLTTLDISGNTSIMDLNCRNNRLTSLDISKSNALVALDCRTNLLTNLDISRNTLLESINLQNMTTLCEVCVWELPFPPANVYVETAGSPNICFDTICNGTCDETGIDENVTTGISIYPNPANDLLTIETEKSGPHSIEITSLNGQLVYSATMEGDTHRIDMTPFSKGAYIIRIMSEETVTTRKVIKL
ncbi:MAG: T9SS type A sorting domain-containing protein [Bacteroidota bacterium]